MVDLVRGPAAERRVRPFLIVAPEEIAQAPYRLYYVRIVFEIDLLPLDGPPEPFDEDVVEDPALAVHADGDIVSLQNVGKILARELRSLVGVEDLGDANGQSLFKGLHTEGSVEREGDLPGEHVPAVPVHDCREIDEALLHGDIGYVRAEDLVGP